MKNNTIIKWGEDVFQPKMCWIRGCNSQRLYWLVGFLNPFEKSACQIGSSSQRVEWTISSRTLDPGCCGGWHLRPKVERLDLVGYPRILQIFIHPWWFSRRISTINSKTMDLWSFFVEVSISKWTARTIPDPVNDKDSCGMNQILHYSVDMISTTMPHYFRHGYNLY